ncbi:MAG TPA: hypothetical protein VEB40_01045 [Flavipsychrobacter sp.]|nr:hypothetical protein [Flavipsychrobacter sp.]
MIIELKIEIPDEKIAPIIEAAKTMSPEAKRLIADSIVTKLKADMGDAIMKMAVDKMMGA